MKRPPGALVWGLALLATMLVLGAAAPWIAPAPPAAQDLARRLEGPSAAHPLGRDDLGRDVLSRLLYGARLSLPLAGAVVTASAAVGGLAGAACGFAGGPADALLVAAADLLLAFPGLLLAIAFVAARGPGVSNLVAALCLIGWVGYARLARGEAIRLRAMPFVEAARAQGAGGRRILLRHLIPLLAGPLGVQAALGVGGVLLAEAGLSFLGLGVSPPTATWGGMLRDGAAYVLDAPRLAVAPGAALAVAVFAAQLTGEGARRLSRRREAGTPAPPGRGAPARATPPR